VAEPLKRNVGLYELDIGHLLFERSELYAENTETEATEDAFDTVQFYESEHGSCQYRTKSKPVE
jgi:hypothetical protein